MRIHALYELNRREILPLLMLGRHLRMRGAGVEIEQLRLASNRMFLDAQEPAVRLVPFLYDDTDAHHSLAYAKWTGEAAVNLCWEQFRSSWTRGRLLPSGKMIDAGMVCLAWGRQYEKELIASGVPRAQVRVTGNLRFDLPKNRRWLLSRDYLANRYQLDADKPWLLIPWNLQLAQGRKSKGMLRMCKRFDLPFPEDQVEVARRTREIFFDLIRRIVETMGDHEIILRAHPSGDDVKELVGRIGSKQSGIRIINEFDIANWIVQSRAVVGWVSTSLLEAIAAGVPTVCFEPVPFTEPFDYDVGRIAPRVDRADEVIDRLRRCECLTDEIDWELFDSWYGPIDGKAHQRVADVCFEVSARGEAFRIPSNIARPVISRLKNASRRVLQHWAGWAPALSWFAHGLRRKTPRWLPPPYAEEVMDGGSVEHLARWLA